MTSTITHGGQGIATRLCTSTSATASALVTGPLSSVQYVIHSSLHSLPHSLICSLAHLFACLLSHSVDASLTHCLMLSRKDSLTQPYTQYTGSLFQSFSRSLTHSLTHSPTFSDRTFNLLTYVPPVYRPKIVWKLTPMWMLWSM